MKNIKNEVLLEKARALDVYEGYDVRGLNYEMLEEEAHYYGGFESINELLIHLLNRWKCDLFSELVYNNLTQRAIDNFEYKLYDELNEDYEYEDEDHVYLDIENYYNNVDMNTLVINILFEDKINNAVHNSIKRDLANSYSILILTDKDLCYIDFDQELKEYKHENYYEIIEEENKKLKQLEIEEEVKKEFELLKLYTQEEVRALREKAYYQQLEIEYNRVKLESGGLIYIDDKKLKYNDVLKTFIYIAETQNSYLEEHYENIKQDKADYITIDFMKVMIDNELELLDWKVRDTAKQKVEKIKVSELIK